ncbi:MAG: MBL fold metallo-hydrolase [Clostridia bacterium]|nr:MBL fold metallo-hydrolase [Clostridia bacterium]
MASVESRIKSRAKSRAKRKIKNQVRKSPIIILILIILAIAAVLVVHNSEKWFGFSFFEDKQTLESVPAPSDGEILFHFIDVGQGDAILITTKSGNMLIDTSTGKEQEKLVSYLERANIKELKYLVLTHTDEDHIGNADHVIENYEVEHVMLPDFAATTKTYERMIDAIDKKNVDLILIGTDEDCEKAGYSFRLGSLVCTVLSPMEEYDDPNDTSIVIKAEYGSTSFMLTGDAEVAPESDMVAAWDKAALKCDVLKIGHHGARNATTQEFLDAVNPRIAVISCGEGNKYGHPTAEVLERLEAAGITVYRTDKDGTIVLKTDGKTVTFVPLDKAE